MSQKRFALPFLLGLMVVLPVRAQTDPLLRARPDFQNQLHDPAPANAPGTSRAQAKSVALFSGGAGAAGDPRTPNDGVVNLVQAGIGQPMFAPAETPTAPAITAQPQNQTVVAGGTAIFTVIASGSAPLSYQWFFNGSTPIAGATGDTLIFSSAGFSDAGQYSVQVSNALDRVTSVTALLTVRAPQPGDVDFSFNPGSVIDGPVYAVAIQPDGKALLGGQFTTVNGVSRNRIARLNVDGTLDDEFLDGLSGVNNTVLSLAVRSDELVLLGGDFLTVNDVSRSRIARLNMDGTLDDDFLDGLSGADNNVRSVVAQSDGKVLLGGGFITVNGVSRNFIARLNADGTLDNGFLAGLSGANDRVWSVAVQSDGKVLIAGQFTTVNGVSRNRIARLNADGTLDNSFLNGLSGADGTVTSLALQRHGQMLLGGSFTSVHGASRNRIARLNADGTLDNSFLNGLSGANGAVLSVAIQSHGQVIIGGNFTSVNEASRNRIARLNVDGTLDSGFLNGLSGADGTVRSVAGESDYTVLIAGDFTSVNGVLCSQVARLHAEPRVPLYTAVNGRGAVTRSPEMDFYIAGSLVTLTAAPRASWHHFLRWSDGVTDNPRSVTVGLTNSFTAIFTNLVPVTRLVTRQWDRAFGGASNDLLLSLQQTTDGGYVVGGKSESGASGNKTHAGFGAGDAWLVRLDAAGNLLWDRTFGGLFEDEWYSVRQAGDGSFVLGGESESGDDGNKTSPNLGNFTRDYWLARVDTNGNKFLDRAFGGVGEDWAGMAQPTSDGGLILGGSSHSDISGNKTSGNFNTNEYATADFWVVRLDAAGNKVWDRSFGGSGEDRLSSLQQTADGGFILGGHSSSDPDGNKTAPRFEGNDFWVVRLDANGNKLWDRSFGDSGDDELTGLKQTPDGGFILCGRSDSGVQGDKTSAHHGLHDFWVVRLDANGNKLWERSFGGGANDGTNGVSIDLTLDGGFIVGGDSSSGASGNKTSPNFGGNDFWILRLDANGTTLWERTYGGATNDSMISLQSTTDGGFILGGASRSGATGNKTAGNFGGEDFWVVKLVEVENPLPIITLTSPTSSARFTALGRIPINATAGDWDGTVTQVNFYATGSMIGTNILIASVNNALPDTNGLSIAWSNVVLGAYTLAAVATDNLGSSATSAPVSIEVVQPFFLAQQGRGTVNASPPGPSYQVGQSVTLTAVPRNPEWTRFLRWSDGNTNATRNITVGTSNVLTAIFTNFVALEELVFKQWDKIYGGTGADQLQSLQTTPDAGYVLAGWSDSVPSGNKTALRHTMGDYWVVRLDSAGNRIWDQSFAALSGAEPCTIIPTDDGGFVLGGSSNGGGNPAFGEFDYWLVRLDSTGAVVWERSYGGIGSDYLTKVRPTADGGFILGGYSSSGIGGNKTTGSFGGSDFWVLRMNGQGVVIWQRSFGGSDADRLTDLVITADGGCLVGGQSASGANGNKTSPGHGLFDFWVVRLDGGGNELWEQSFGGSNHDSLYAMQQTPDGGFILGGSSSSSMGDGNKESPNWGVWDFWVVRLDVTGGKLWDRSYGSSGTDELFGLDCMPDGGFVLGGIGWPLADGTKTIPGYDFFDYWSVRISANGDQLWDQVHGGLADDRLTSLRRAADGGFAFGGYSLSSDTGNKTSPTFGETDFWVVKAVERTAPVGTPVVLVNGLYSPSNHFTIPATNMVSVELQTTFTNGFLFYTLDGSPPDFNSTPYTGSFTVTQSFAVRAIAYSEGGSEVREADPVTISIVPLYTITDLTIAGGTVSLDPPGGIYLSNTVLTLTATPSNGWTFMRWGGDPFIAFDNPLQLTVNRSYSVRALFGTSIVTNVPGGGGGIAINPPQGPYMYGRTARLNGIPAAGKYFSRWFNFATGPTTNPLDYLVLTNTPTVSAFFANLPSNNFTLTVLLNGDGTVTRSPFSGFYTNGTNVTLTALPDSHYVFAGWSGDTNSLLNPLNVVMDSSKTITATFVFEGVPGSPVVVAILSPTNGAAFLAGTTVPLSARAGRVVGVVTNVAFFAGPTLLGSVTNGLPGTNLFNLSWSNAPVGSHTLRVVATDNSGLSVTSAPVSITASEPQAAPLFSMAATSYPVAENVPGGVVEVVILKSSNSTAGSVTVQTRDGLATAVAGGSGDYVPVNTNVAFAAGETFKSIFVTIVADVLAEGNHDFVVFLSNPTAGGALLNPTNSIITIVDDDVPSLTDSVTSVVLPGPVPPFGGSLRVVMLPLEAQGQWRFAWEPFWRNSNSVATGLPAGNYDLEFRPVNGFFTPVPLLVPVLASGETVATNFYLSSGATGAGDLTVEILPASVAVNLPLSARGGWRLQGELGYHDSGVTLNQLNAGTYIVEFKSVSDPVTTWITPPSRTVRVFAGQKSIISASYFVGDAPAGTTPSVLAFPSYTSAQPYAFCGQLLADAGYGSGFVVKERVVLTAAHVVFNDATFSYASDVRWFFQRHAGVYEPPPQRPRGWYVFSGYSAQRMTENTPGVSTLDSRQLDVAALYFTEGTGNANLPGRGGHGGFLVSDAVTNQWLGAHTNKLLTGYPLDGINPAGNRGRLHATVPQDHSFLKELQQVYSTTEITSFPGNSGGALCVAYNNQFYPAAVYLGGFSKTIVRAIDSQVVDLINRAEVSGNGGGNNTGGGVITVTTGAGASGLCAGSVRVNLGPPSVLIAGGAWRVPERNISFTTNVAELIPLQGGAFTIECRAVPGYVAPTNRLVEVACGQSAEISLSYTVERPVFAYVPGADLRLSGTTGAVFRIERAFTLTGPANWTSVATVTLASGSAALPGTQPTTNGSRFYRAVWAP